MDKYGKIGVVITVLIIIAAIISYTYFTSQGNSSNVSQDNQPVSQAVLAQLYTIANNQTLAKAVGTGAVSTFPASVTGNALVTNGKPTILYIGAEYCPYCAATRWAIALALMRFGNFSSLSYMTSSASDAYPNTPTFTFYNSTYSSSIINFVSVELYTNKVSNQTNYYAILQTPAQWENKTMAKYGTSGSIPFIDFGNMSVQQGAPYSPGLIYRDTWPQIISQLGNANSSISQSVIGATNIFTAQICRMTNFTPSRVCDAPYVKEVLAS